MTILGNAGAGILDAPPTSPEAVGDNPPRIIAADFDGDADPDLAIANQGSSTVTVLRNR